MKIAPERLAAEEIARAEMCGGARPLLVLGCVVSPSGRAALRLLAGLGGSAPEAWLAPVVPFLVETARGLHRYGLAERRRRGTRQLLTLTARGLDVLSALPAPGPSVPTSTEELRRCVLRGLAVRRGMAAGAAADFAELPTRGTA